MSKKVSQSQRLRNILYLLWDKDKRGHENFDTYYAEMMEKIIEFYKQKL